MKIVKKGFTLIELLIVIVVIGILSAMMMLASTEVEASADVMRVISDMTAVKTAILMCITDNPDKYPNPPLCEPPDINEVKKYLANEDIINNHTGMLKDKWDIKYKSNQNGDKWFLYYQLPDYLKDSASFKRKLASQAKKHMLFWSEEDKPIEQAIQDGDCWYDGGTTAGGSHVADNVFMLIMYQPKS